MRSVIATLGLLASQALAMPTISAKGSKFFDSDGNQFFIKGIAYQLTPNDPLNQDQCKTDANLMKELGTNSIRVYHVDPNSNHDECMKAFADAGIYLWLDLDTFDTYIQGPGMEQPQWNQTQFEAYQKVMDAFADYDNLAGFFVGNEVLTTSETSPAAPYVKAAGADMKKYRDSKGYREIPIGYTGADVTDLRPMLQNYLACGDNSSQALDFFGLNAYEWCGEQDYQTSGYVNLQEMSEGYNIPIFFSETGCNTVRPRTFGDQAAIFGDKMIDTWSGAIIYEWLQETNDYGIVSYAPTNGEEFGVIGTPTPIDPDFSNLKSAWATITPSGVKKADYSPSLTPPPCPAYTSGEWMVSPSAPLPTVGAALATDDSSSQTRSGGSSSTRTGSNSPSGIASGGGSGNNSDDNDTDSSDNSSSDSSSNTSGAGSGSQVEDNADSAESSGTPSSAANVNVKAPASTSLGLMVGAYVVLCGVAGVALL